MTVAERFRGLRWIRLDETGITMRQVHGEEMGFLLHTADPHHRLAEIRLGVTRFMDQRHEHFPLAQALATNIVLDDGVATGKAMLVPQPFINPLSRVPLLARTALVRFQKRVDNAGKSIQLRPLRCTASLIPRRNGKPQNLSHRLAVHPKHPSRFPNTHPFDVTGPSNFRIKFHWIHPLEPSSSAETLSDPSEGNNAVHFWTATTGPSGRFRGTFCSAAYTLSETPVLAAAPDSKRPSFR
jgi:hypothetical protein